MTQTMESEMPQPDGRAETPWDDVASPTDQAGVVIRRRAGLMAVVAVAALALSVAYLWQFGQNGAALPLLIGIALGLIAVFHGLAWGDARTPLLMADEIGLRVRLGGDWTGVPWSHVERVEVDGRGRVSDGHVAVMAAESAGELAHARWRSRLGAVGNRWLYDAPLVVPYGLATTLSVSDLPATLTRLADGRAPIIVLDGIGEEPEPTVALTGALAAVEQAPDEAATDATIELDPVSTSHMDSAVAADEAPSGNDLDGHETAPSVDETVEESVETAAGHGEVQPDASDSARKPRGKARRSLIGVRDVNAALPLAKVVAALRSHPARREEVTLPGRSEPATIGTLALSQPYPEPGTEPLPEIEHLRRQDYRHISTDIEPVSNVGLIIDATTDLSARAMRKVRSPAPLGSSNPATRDDVVRPEGPDGVEDLVIGDIVRQARQRLSMTVDEVADRTRIRPFVIESIEVDDFGPCGGDFYARGHLRMLARVLGIEVEPLLVAYDDSFASSPVNPRAVFDAELSTGATGMVRSGSSGANWGALIAAVLVLMLTWGVAKYVADGTAVPGTGRAAVHNSSGLGSPGPGNRPLPAPASPRATVRVAAVGGASRVVVKDRTGRVVFHGVLTDGQVHMATGLAPLHVMAVDGGVVRLGTAGHSLGFVGAPGTRSRHLISAP